MREDILDDGDFLSPFSVTVFDESATISRRMSDLFAAGICKISVLDDTSVPLTSIDAFNELVSVPACVGGVISCVIVVPESVVFRVGGDEAAGSVSACVSRT